MAALRTRQQAALSLREGIIKFNDLSQDGVESQIKVAVSGCGGIIQEYNSFKDSLTRSCSAGSGTLQRGASGQ